MFFVSDDGPSTKLSKTKCLAIDFVVEDRFDTKTNNGEHGASHYRHVTHFG